MDILSSTILDGFNRQIGNELRNSHNYLNIAAYFKDKALFNLAKEYQTEAEGERGHAQKFIDFIIDFRGRVEIPTVEPPVNTIVSAVEAARLALSLEIKTTKDIYNLVDIAQSEKNHIVYNFLLWFVGEQQEELATATDRLSIIERNKNNLELADMVFEK